MKYTVLQLVQRILSAIDGDEVNSISDTVESEQVSFILERTYYDIAASMEIPEQETLFSLDASGDNTKPVLMTLPAKVIDLEWIQYDVKEGTQVKSEWRDMEFCTLSDFIQRMRGFEDDSDTTTASMDLTTNDGTFEFLYRNDRMPSYYTILGESQFIFDSVNLAEQNTLEETDTMCFGKVYVDFTLSDNFTPDLDSTQFSYLLNKATARAFIEVKQQDNPDARQEARQQKVSSQKRKRNVPFGGETTRIVGYGRK